MLQYIEHIIVPYVEKVREDVGSDKAALVIMDNFNGQITASVTSLLDQNNIHVCLLLSNTTDLLQPLDISVNKPAKEFLKRQFQQWYSEEVMKQLEGRDLSDLESTQPIDLGMPVLKHIGLVDMAEYISDNSQFIVNGFMHSGIPGDIDRLEDETESDSEASDSTRDKDSSDIIGRGEH